MFQTANWFDKHVVITFTVWLQCLPNMCVEECACAASAGTTV